MKLLISVLISSVLVLAIALDGENSVRPEDEPNNRGLQRSSVRATVVGNDGRPGSAFPLQVCQGDCDSDRECQAGLVCFRRRSNEPVPGCTGLISRMNGRDFCYDPSFAGSQVTGSLARVGNDGNPSNAFPLKKCEGDCDSDRDCQSGLICLQRNAQSSNTVPGCSGTARDGTDFCVDPQDVRGFTGTPPAPTPSSAGQLALVGDNGRPSRAFPLKRCQGDCDRDSDCESSLVCFQRNSDQTSVPGCGRASNRDSIDYCIRPLDMAPIRGSFRLKLYWEPGYFWQEETIERKWCMECDGTGCDFDDSIHVQRCGSSNTWFVFENLRNGETQVRVAGKNLCLELISNNSIRLRNCDSSKDRQKFRAGLGSFGGDKFELQTIVHTGCLSQQHHPKADEVIRRYDCEVPRSRGDRTNFWNRY